MVERKPLHVCLVCPRRVSTELGQYLDALVKVRPGQDA